MIPAWLIVGLSFFAVGCALYLAWCEVERAWRERSPWPLAYALTRVSFSVMVMLIAEDVFHMKFIPVTWRSIIYTLAAVGVFAGYIGVVFDQRRRDRRKPDREGRDT